MKSLLQFLISVSFLFCTLSMKAQIPQNVEAKYDALMEAYVRMFTIIINNEESDAVKLMEEMKDDLRKKAEVFKEAIDIHMDVSKYNEKEWEERIKNKSYYKEMIGYYNDDRFTQKWQSSELIQQKMEEINAILDTISGNNENEEDTALNQSSFATIEIPSLKDTYNVIPETEEYAVAYEDDLGNLTFDILGYSGGSEVSLYFFIEEARTGRYEWSTEGNFIIEIYDENGEQLHGYWGNEGQGYIVIDNLAEPGDYITGSFSGRFRDDMEEEGRLTTVSGKFKALVSEAPY